MFKSRKPKDLSHKLREWVWPKAGWARTVQYIIHRLIRLDDGPHAIALGMACGAFVSASPFLGTHFIQAALLALLIRGNVIAAAIGTWIGNPLSFPFIWVGTYQLGSYILGVPEVQRVNFDPALLNNVNFLLLIKPLLTPMFIGSLPIGLGMAVLIYFPSFWVVRSYKRAVQERKQHKRTQSEKEED